MPGQEKPTRKLAAIMFADIAGYTALMQEAEAQASATLRRFQSVMREKVSVHRGSIVNEMGDGMLCVFDAPQDAVRCAMELNASFSQTPKVPVRFGIHSGTVVYEEDKIYGNSVNIAARIESMGVPGAILISRKVNSEIANHPDISTSSLGKFNFKNIKEPIEVFGISNAECIVPERSQLRGKFEKQTNLVPKLWLGAIFAVLVIGGIVARKFFWNNNQSLQLDKKSIAVLPFENMSGSDDAYFAAGITEDILTQISKIGDLKVISRFTLKEYDSEGKTPAEIGEELKVAHLLAGSIRRVGTELRIACQLINTEDQTESWAETFDRHFENIFAIQSEVAQKVANELKAKLSEREKYLIDQPPTTNLEAYNHFLKGRDIFNGNNGISNDKSIDHYLEALRLDSTFALAWAALSSSYSSAVFSYGNRPGIYLDSALMAAQKSVDLAPDESQCWGALGLVHDVMGKYELAVPMYEKALKLNPNNPSTLTNLSLIYNERGQLSESIFQQKKSIEIEPLRSNTYNALAVNFRRLEMYAEAFEQLELALALDPDNWITLYYIAYTNILNGTPEEATPFIEKMVQLDPENARLLEIAGELSHYYDPKGSRQYFEKAMHSEIFDPEINFFTPVGLGYYLWEEGQIDSANVWFEISLLQQQQLIDQGSEDLNPVMLIASIHSIRGENEKAIQLLKNVDAVSFDFKSWELSPMSSGLIGDPQFQEFVKTVHTKIVRMRKNVILKG